MAFYFLAGRYLNHLSRAMFAPTPTPAADTGFPIGGLYDGRSNLPFRFGSVAADSRVEVDLNMLPGGNGEAADDPSNWTVALGALTVDAAIKYAGAGSLKLANGAGSSSASVYVPARAGESLRFNSAIYGTGAGTVAAVLVQNLQTGRYLQPGGASWGAAVALDTQAAAAWKAAAVSFTVESAAESLAVNVTLRIDIYTNGVGSCYFDDLTLVPAVTWASIHGHNVTPALTPKVQSSPDGVTWTDRITPTNRRRVIFGTCAAQYYRYWRLLLSGTPTAAPYIGELVLGQHSTLLTAPDYPLQVEIEEAQARSGTAQGAEHVYSRGGAERYRVTLPLVWTSDAGYQQARDAIFVASRGGAHPMVLAPTETDSDLCFLGRGRAVLSPTRTAYNRREGEIEILEDPLPLMG
jgi:hypothetical protein